MVMTSKTICFTLTGEDVVRDSIPLKEILAIQIMEAAEDVEALQAQLRDIQEKKQGPRSRHGQRGSISSDSNAALQIRTIPDGFNSGTEMDIFGHSQHVILIVW